MNNPVSVDKGNSLFFLPKKESNGVIAAATAGAGAYSEATTVPATNTGAASTATNAASSTITTNPSMTTGSTPTKCVSDASIMNHSLWMVILCTLSTLLLLLL